MISFHIDLGSVSVWPVLLSMLISMILSCTQSGPCDTPVMPLQLIAVGVMDGVDVGRGV